VYDTFNLHVPTACPGVPSDLLNPKKSWTGKAEFQDEVTKLGVLFVENFKKYSDEATPEVIKAGTCWTIGGSQRTFTDERIRTRRLSLVGRLLQRLIDNLIFFWDIMGHGLMGFPL
jgi:hypothetical protein